MIDFKVVITGINAIAKAHKANEAKRTKLMAKAFKEAGHATRRSLVRKAKGSFKTFPPWMEKGILWRYKKLPEHTLRLFINRRQEHLFAPHVKPTHTRKRRSGKPIWIFVDSKRGAKKLIPAMDAGTDKVKSTRIRVLQYKDRHYLAVTNKIGEGMGKVVAIGVPEARYKRIFRFHSHATRYGRRALIKHMRKEGFRA